MSQTNIPGSLRQRVTDYFLHRCAYCQTAERVIGAPLEMDHIVPESQGGLTTEENLSLACSPCNNHKADHTTALDLVTGEIVPLFNPRQQRWLDHFAWTKDSELMVGLYLLNNPGRPTQTCQVFASRRTGRLSRSKT